MSLSVCVCGEWLDYQGDEELEERKAHIKEGIDNEWFKRGDYCWLPSIFEINIPLKHGMNEEKRMDDEGRLIDTPPSAKRRRIDSSTSSTSSKEMEMDVDPPPVPDLNGSSVNISTNIHSLFLKGNPVNNVIYHGIEHVFHQMLPLFYHLKAFREYVIAMKGHIELKVIVKSQRYEIKDGTGYSGHWHSEGLIENIKWVGLYYFERDENLKGGSLKFRPRKIPDPSFLDDDESQLNSEIEIGEGSAIVFENTGMAHRVRVLSNRVGDGQSRWRSFLAFFIIDPCPMEKLKGMGEEKVDGDGDEVKMSDKPVISVGDMATYREYPSLCIEEYAPIVNGVMCGYSISGKEGSMDVALLICEYADCGYTLKAAKIFRNEAIAIKKGNKGAFGAHMYGNCGDYKFYQMGQALKYNVNMHGFNEESFEIQQLEEGFVTSTDSGADKKLHLE